MKKLLLPAILPSVSYLACAQVALVQLLLIGGKAVRAARERGAGKGRAVGIQQAVKVEKPDPDARPVTYRAHILALKRTPPNELHGKGIEEITRLEAMLQQCYITMTTDSMARVLPDSVLTPIRINEARISGLRPNWNLNSYHHDEYNFYLGEDARRQRVARAVAVPTPAK